MSWNAEFARGLWQGGERFRRDPAPPVCLLCGVQGVAMEAVSREVTDVLWDSHHTNGVWFSLWVVLYPVI